MLVVVTHCQAECKWAHWFVELMAVPDVEQSQSGSTTAFAVVQCVVNDPDFVQAAETCICQSVVA